MRTLLLAALAAAAIAGPLSANEAAAQSSDCTAKLGGVLSLTGSMGPIGKKIADAAQLGIEHINQGGGVNGCKLEFILRDDQGQPTVGVDAAKYLVDVEGVPALTGAISSGVTLPILTSVAVPNNIPQISCCSTASTFTTMAKEGKTNGLYFRTLPTVKTQAYASAKVAADQGWKKIAMIYVNTDFGTGMVKDFKTAMEALGGEVVAEVAYNENQPSYRAEVNQARASDPDAVFLVAFPQDGATMTREWLSLGGTQNLILNNALRSEEYVKSVGSRFLQNAYGMDNASAGGDTVKVFEKAYQDRFGTGTDSPGLHTQYDAVMILGLAMNIADSMDGLAIRDAIRETQNPEGAVIGTGPDEFARAVALIDEGKPIRYSGATGPITFDANGDVSGPALIWGVEGDDLVVKDTLDLDAMNALMKKIDG